MFRAAIPIVVACLSLTACRKQVSPAIEGKWVKPFHGFSSYSLSLEGSGNYIRWFSSDVIGGDIPENPKRGRYTSSGDRLTLPVINRYRDGTTLTYSDQFNRETINGVEVLMGRKAEEIWIRCGMIYTGGLLIKISDDPAYSEPQDEPDAKRLFSNGVAEWSEEAEAARKAGKAAANP